MFKLATPSIEVVIENLRKLSGFFVYFVTIVVCIYLVHGGGFHAAYRAAVSDQEDAYCVLNVHLHELVDQDEVRLPVSQLPGH